MTLVRVGVFIPGVIFPDGGTADPRVGTKIIGIPGVPGVPGRMGEPLASGVGVPPVGVGLSTGVIDLWRRIAGETVAVKVRVPVPVRSVLEIATGLLERRSEYQISPAITASTINPPIRNSGLLNPFAWLPLKNAFKDCHLPVIYAKKDSFLSPDTIITHQRHPIPRNNPAFI